MLKNFVKETASAPGTSTTFNLGGATAPFVTFAASFSNGATCLYVMYSTTQAEWGVGTVTHGSPNTLSRTTVSGNTVGTTSKLNFTGTTTVICAPIAEKAVYKNANGDVTIAALTATGSVNVGTSGTGSQLFINGTNATDVVRIYNTAGTKFLAFKPETATSEATFGYWTGAAWGSMDFPGTTQMDGALTYGGVTLSNSVTGTGSMVLSASPTLTTMLVVSTNPTVSPIQTDVPGTGTALALGFSNDNGAVGSIATSGSSTFYNTSSDYRLKVTYGRADGSIIQRLRVYDAAFISDGARYPMFLAHELQEDGAGFTVYGEKDGPQMQGVDHSKLVPALVAYAQQLRADLDRAVARLNAIGA
jgi:hypothetical protein